MRLLLIYIFVLHSQPGQASELASTMLQMHVEIQQTKDPVKKERMQKRFNQRMGPRFEQQMRNAQNNLHRSLNRLNQAMKHGKTAIASVEINTFQKHLQRFEKLSKAGNKLARYSTAKFEVRVSKGTGARSRFFVFQTSPNMNSFASNGSLMASNVKSFISKFGLFSKPKAYNTAVRTPPNDSGTTRGKPSRAAPLKIDSLNPGPLSTF